jgi:hypothetical protein
MTDLKTVLAGEVRLPEDAVMLNPGDFAKAKAHKFSDLY